MKILGIGNAIVDILCKVPDEFLKKHLDNYIFPKTGSKSPNLLVKINIIYVNFCKKLNIFPNIQKYIQEYTRIYPNILYIFVYIWIYLAISWYFFGVVTCCFLPKNIPKYIQIYTNIYKMYKIYAKYQAAARRRQPGRRLVFCIYLVYICIYLDILWYFLVS